MPRARCPVSGSECHTERCAEVGCWAAEEDFTPVELGLSESVGILPGGFFAQRLNKHDEGCMRRRDNPRTRFLCTCGFTDEDVAAAVANAFNEKRESEEA